MTKITEEMLETVVDMINEYGETFDYENWKHKYSYWMYAEQFGIAEDYSRFIDEGEEYDGTVEEYIANWKNLMEECFDEVREEMINDIKKRYRIWKGLIFKNEYNRSIHKNGQWDECYDSDNYLLREEIAELVERLKDIRNV